MCHREIVSDRDFRKRIAASLLESVKTPRSDASRATQYGETRPTWSRRRGLSPGSEGSYGTNRRAASETQCGQLRALAGSPTQVVAIPERTVSHSGYEDARVVFLDRAD